MFAAAAASSEEFSLELDAVMEAIGGGGANAEKEKEAPKKTPIITKGNRVMWLCEVDGELMVLQKLRDFRKAEEGRAPRAMEEKEERVSFRCELSQPRIMLGAQAARAPGRVPRRAFDEYRTRRIESALRFGDLLQHAPSFTLLQQWALPANRLTGV